MSEILDAVLLVIVGYAGKIKNILQHNMHHNYIFVFLPLPGCDAIKHDDEDEVDMVATAKSGTAADNRHPESDMPSSAEHHQHPKSSRMMHEESSNENYLQVSILCVSIAITGIEQWQQC